MSAVETSRLGKRYGHTWALRDCTLAIPAGRVVALVGPNGAGKTTLLHLAVGLAAPSTGAINVLGNVTPGSDEALSRVGFVAQDTPLYPGFRVAETVRLVGSLSDRWDEADARRRIAAAGIPLDRRVGRLSGGQRAQVALAVALARHPELLVLDEPVARLDPLARHEIHELADGGGGRGGDLRGLLIARGSRAGKDLRLPGRPFPGAAAGER